MIARLRNSSYIKILWGLMGLYLLNISVDSADLHPDHISEDLSINDQESIIELVVEQVLGFEDAIKEYDDHDSENHNLKKNQKIDFLINLDKAFSKMGSSVVSERKSYPHHEAGIPNSFSEISTPPPKV